MDCTAAHCDGYSPRCSCTNRTARSRTSGENLLFLLMAPFSQKLEPPQNPGRFSIASSSYASHSPGGMCTCPSIPSACIAASCARSEEHTSELHSREKLVCRLLLEKKKQLDKR